MIITLKVNKPSLLQMRLKTDDKGFLSAYTVLIKSKTKQ